MSLSLPFPPGGAPLILLFLTVFAIIMPDMTILRPDKRSPHKGKLRLCWPDKRIRYERGNPQTTGSPKKAAETSQTETGTAPENPSGHRYRGGGRHCGHRAREFRLSCTAGQNGRRRRRRHSRKPFCRSSRRQRKKNNGRKKKPTPFICWRWAIT